MIVKIDFVPGVDESSVTYRNVTEVRTVDVVGYKRLIIDTEGDFGPTKFSTPAYLIKSIEVKDGD